MSEENPEALIFPAITSKSLCHLHPEISVIIWRAEYESKVDCFLLNKVIAIQQFNRQSSGPFLQLAN